MPLRAFLCWIMFFGWASQAAADGLAPLRVDPALLGGTAATPAAPAVPAAAVPAATPAPAPTTAKPAALPQEAPPAKPVILDTPQRMEPAPAAPPSRSEAPPAQQPPVPAATAAPAPAPLPRTMPAAETAVAKPDRVPSPRIATADATRSTGMPTLPPLRVDPALLGPMPSYGETAPNQIAASASSSAAGGGVRTASPAGAAARTAAATGAESAAALTQSTEPPLVAERPALPPLYSAHVAAGELPAPNLKASRAMSPLPHDSAEPRPSFVSGDSIHGRTDVEMIAEGNAQLRKIGTVLDADRLTYWHLDDEVEALGNVRLQRDADVFTGPKLRMKVEENTGYFEQPTYSMPRTITSTPGTLLGSTEKELPTSRKMTAQGSAERIEFQGEGLFHLNKATYSTCAAGNEAWYATANDLNLDYNREVGEGSDGKLVFQGVPILYSPWLSFSLDNQRKSGLLSPSFGTTNTSGTEISVPWYWNIAPNMDATITPRIMQKRGVQWGTEFRYLDANYSGQTQVDYLPNDHLENKRRFGYVIQHQQNFGYGFSGNLNLNGVSDDTYFRDLSRPGSLLAQNYLPRQGTLMYGASWWNASIMAQRYQVLQDPSLPPVAELYRRLPQINLTANRYDLPFGSALNFSGEYVRFDHPTSIIGKRSTLYPQISLPLQSSFFQITPKLGYHVTHYAVDRQGAGVPDNMSVRVPVFSIDSSVVFERDTEMFGRNLINTLEPRLYYLYVPYRDQSQIPVFDTGVADFNFAQIFAENRYAGGDRIADANQITAAVTSRLIDPATGSELIRGALGQVYYFTTQHVALPAVIAADGTVTTPAETPRAGRSADLLAALSGQVMPKTYVDTGWQYNPRDKLTERLTFGGRYQPEIGKVLNAGYRYTRDLLGQIDVSAQWPLGGGWHGVGRYNFSTKDKHLIESLGGIEYDGGCWVGRVVVQRIATQTQKATTSLFFQIELNGFSRLGSNPLDILKRSVPGYWRVDQSPVNADATSY
jgi:LPS-assembly protein